MNLKKILIVFFTAIAITLMMPGGGMVSLEATPGKVWEQATLIAPFDIPIARSAAKINEEQQKVQRAVRPVFALDTANSMRRIEQMTSALNAAQIATAQRDTAIATATRIYQAGIISLGEANSYNDRAILVHHNNDQTLRSEHSSHFFTPMHAVEIISQNSSLSPEMLSPYIAVNLTYDERLTNAIRDQAFADVSTTEGVVRRGETVITRGQIIDQPMIRTLNSLRSELETRLGEGTSDYIVGFGRLMIVLTVFLLNYLFFTRFAVNYFGARIREMAFVMTTYLIIISLVAICVHSGVISAYIVPLPIVAIYLLTFFNMRVAIFGNATIALLGAMFVKAPFDFFIINFLSGMMAIYVMRHFYHRGKLMRAFGAILLTQVIIYASLTLMREGSFAAIGYRGFIWFSVSGLLFLGFYQLLYLVERMFGFVSDVTLLELCDTNQPLLMQLAQNAPGTFQHSVQVANLAESAAKEIGANPLVARTGAMYHDVGKMDNPFYFVENLSGTFNPHDDCTIEQSVAIIKAHISDGVAIARRYKLPTTVIEFIEQHHGESLIYYFYNKAKKEQGSSVAEADFRYLGPLPVTKEVSICMMADAVEAASRSLPSYEKEPLEALVDSVIDVQVRTGQFAMSQMTFEDIRKVKDVFKSKLNNIYHGRIAYPVREQ